MGEVTEAVIAPRDLSPLPVFDDDHSFASAQVTAAQQTREGGEGRGAGEFREDAGLAGDAVGGRLDGVLLDGDDRSAELAYGVERSVPVLWGCAQGARDRPTPSQM